MENCPFVSIVIPIKNEEKLLAKCLKSLAELNYPKDRFEVIIADGLSTDSTPKIAESFGAKVVKNEKQTVAPGRNIGFLVSKGELAAFSDADCVMDKQWLENCLKYFEKEEVAGIGGPNLVPPDETNFGRAVRFLMSFGSFASGSVQVTDSKQTKEVKSLPGSNCIYKREALVKVMPIDETLLTCDDTEMNWQLRNKGYKLLYVPDVMVWHYRRDNPKKFFKQMYRYARGRVQLSRKHKDALDLLHILFGFGLPIAFVSGIILFILNPVYILVLTGAALFSLLAFSFLGLLKEKSLGAALNVPLVSFLFAIAWSLGFLRELFFGSKAKRVIND